MESRRLAKIANKKGAVQKVKELSALISLLKKRKLYTINGNLLLFELNIKILFQVILDYLFLKLIRNYLAKQSDQNNHIIVIQY